MKLKDSVYNHEEIIKRLLSKIENSEIDGKSKQNLFDFYSDCVVHSLSKARTAKCLDTLLRIAIWLGKPFDDATKEDVVRLVLKIETGEYSPWTKHDYKAILRVFFRWLRKTEEYPPEVKWIKNTVRHSHKLPEEILTPEEVVRLVETANNLRDKALVLTLYDSGCRIGEILTLQMKHAQFDSYGAVLIVDGKTGQRRVRLIMSAPKLGQWVENHPMRNDPEAPLWVTIGTRNRNAPLRYFQALHHLKKLAKQAGIAKRVYPHLFRHSRATHLANVLTEAQMKQHFGWVQASDMASTYVHLSGRDVDRALLKMNGIEVPEEGNAGGLQAKRCPRCKGGNSPEAKFCSHCGMCLDSKVAMEIDDARLKADNLMAELVKRPEILEQMLHAVEAINE